MLRQTGASCALSARFSTGRLRQGPPARIQNFQPSGPVAGPRHRSQKISASRTTRILNSRVCGAGPKCSRLRRASKIFVVAARIQNVRSCDADPKFSQLRRGSKIFASATRIKAFKIFALAARIQNFRACGADLQLSGLCGGSSTILESLCHGAKIFVPAPPIKIFVSVSRIRRGSKIFAPAARI